MAKKKTSKKKVSAPKVLKSSRVLYFKDPDGLPFQISVPAGSPEESLKLTTQHYEGLGFTGTNKQGYDSAQKAADEYIAERIKATEDFEEHQKQKAVREVESKIRKARELTQKKKEEEGRAERLAAAKKQVKRRDLLLQHGMELVVANTVLELPEDFPEKPSGGDIEKLV